jgi:hypothetical protein
MLWARDERHPERSTPHESHCMSDRAKPRRAGPVGTDRPCPHQPPTIGAASGDRAAGRRRREQHGHCHSVGRSPAHRAALAGPLCHGAAGGVAGSPPLPAAPPLSRRAASGHRGPGVPGACRAGLGGPDALVSGRPGAVPPGPPGVGAGRPQQEHRRTYPPGTRPAPGPPLSPGWRSATRTSCPKPWR